MKHALILAAGRGARLDRPNTPKPLVDIGGQPIAVRLIRQLEAQGIEQAHVVLGYQRQMIRRKLSAHPFEKIEVVFHTNPRWQRGMADSVLCCENALIDPFVLVMGDHVFDDELIEQLLRAKRKEDQTLALIDDRLDTLHDLDTAMKVRTVPGRILQVGRSLDSFDAVDAGLFAAAPDLFGALRQARAERDDAELLHGLNLLVEKGALGFVKANGGTWHDIDTPIDVIRAETRIREKRRSRTAAPARASSATGKLRRNFIYKITPKAQTTIAVQRGVVADPCSVDIIPSASASSPVFVFSDELVRDLYGKRFFAQLKDRGYNVHEIVMPVGEEAKTLSNYVYQVERVLSRGVDERSVFISLGGGVVCNVCGFIASTIYRGLELVHIPTTLMAQCDAAISHKQAINGFWGKNMVGSYYCPNLVAVDVESLSTLTDRQIRDGLAEVIKHGLGQDRGLAEFLLAYRGSIRDLDFLEHVIARNIELKCELVTRDPKENREGLILQYGHTVGHPIEHLSGYSILHGESVGIGMVVAAKVSRILGSCSDELVTLHEAILSKYGLPTKAPSAIRTADMIEALKYNKKYLMEGTRMALLSDVGELWDVDGDFAIPVSDQVLAAAFESTVA